MPPLRDVANTTPTGADAHNRSASKPPTHRGRHVLRANANEVVTATETDDDSVSPLSASARKRRSAVETEALIRDFERAGACAFAFDAMRTRCFHSTRVTVDVLALFPLTELTDKRFACRFIRRTVERECAAIEKTAEEECARITAEFNGKWKSMPKKVKSTPLTEYADELARDGGEDALLELIEINKVLRSIDESLVRAVVDEEALLRAAAKSLVENVASEAEKSNEAPPKLEVAIDDVEARGVLETFQNQIAALVARWRKN